MSAARRRRRCRCLRAPRGPPPPSPPSLAAVAVYLLGFHSRVREVLEFAHWFHLVESFPDYGSLLAHLRTLQAEGRLPVRPPPPPPPGHEFVAHGSTAVVVDQAVGAGEEGVAAAAAGGAAAAGEAADLAVLAGAAGGGAAGGQASASSLLGGSGDGEGGGDAAARGYAAPLSLWGPSALPMAGDVAAADVASGGTQTDADAGPFPRHGRGGLLGDAGNAAPGATTSRGVGDAEWR